MHYPDTSGVGELDFVGTDFLVRSADYALICSFIRIHRVMDHQSSICQHRHSIVPEIHLCTVKRFIKK